MHCDKVEYIYTYILNYYINLYEIKVFGKIKICYCQDK